jgi:acid phosphatase type 7
MRDVWGLLDNHRAEIVFSGHDHLYERFARQMSDCAADSTNGVHNIVAGTAAPSFTTSSAHRQIPKSAS